MQIAQTTFCPKNLAFSRRWGFLHQEWHGHPDTDAGGAGEDDPEEGDAADDEQPAREERGLRRFRGVYIIQKKHRRKQKTENFEQ